MRVYKEDICSIGILKDECFPLALVEVDCLSFVACNYTKIRYERGNDPFLDYTLLDWILELPM
jgi:hypothetical protein